MYSSCDWSFFKDNGRKFGHTMRIGGPRNRLGRPSARVRLFLGVLCVFSSVTLLQYWGGGGHDPRLDELVTQPVEPTRPAVTTNPTPLRYTCNAIDREAHRGRSVGVKRQTCSAGVGFFLCALQPNHNTAHAGANALTHAQVRR